MTANQTKFMLSSIIVVVGAAVVSPFYWYYSVRTPSAPVSSAAPTKGAPVPVSPVAAPAPQVISAPSAPSVVNVVSVPQVVMAEQPVQTRHATTAVLVERSQHTAILQNGMRTYRYTVSGKVKGDKLPEQVELLLDSDYLGEHEDYAHVAADGSFVIQGSFEDRVRGQLGWRLIAMPSEGASSAEASGRLILTEDTELTLERTLVLPPS